ncbi:MAG: hypothetical protein RBS37_11870 [Bacteroidales bacterium]|jgi:hypothetical protein|nr:hypothetical protein [Bacteroidales bacterium]
MIHAKLKSALLFSLFCVATTIAAGQGQMPEELTTGTIREQINYIENKTRIYEDFRAIREDMFRKLNRNILDTLSAEKGKVTELTNLTAALNGKRDSLNVLLESTRNDLAQVTATKEKISVLGLEIKKKAYNAIMWTLLGGLLFIMAVGFLIFKRNLVVLLRTEKDLKELKEEFEAYRQSSRIAREKVEMDLFRANQKLKGK